LEESEPNSPFIATDYSAMLCSLVGKHMMAALSGTLGRQITLKQLMGFDETIQ